MSTKGSFEGKRAPAFCLPNQSGTKVCLRDLRTTHRLIVLYFYPKDMTSGCTREAQEFSALKRKFAARGVGIIGISKDPVKRHQKFIEKEGLTIDLLSDEECTVLEKYDVWQEKSMYGRKYMGIMRETFVIDTAQGKIVRHWQKVRPAEHAQEVLDFVAAYKK